MSAPKKGDKGSDADAGFHPTTQNQRKPGAPKGNKNAIGNKGGLGGPPKYDATIPDRAFRLCLLGASDAELADAFGVAESTINLWKHEHIEFARAIVRGKLEADSVVAEGLYRRAAGYERKAVKIFMPAGRDEPVYADYEEHFPPDPQAARYWLNNRQRGKWADRIEHTGANGGAIVTQSLDLRALGQEERELLLTLMRQALAKPVQQIEGEFTAEDAA